MKLSSYYGCSEEEAVSLFTREWIEMIVAASFAFAHAVSLFTREWIEINEVISGWQPKNRLPLYEGVD